LQEGVIILKDDLNINYQNNPVEKFFGLEEESQSNS